MEYAVVVSGGKQYWVTPGSLLEVDRLKAEVGTRIQLKPVLAARKGEVFYVGQPELSGIQVQAEVVTHRKGPKGVAFRFKRRKGYHRKVGYRQALTRLKILEIAFDGTH
jgi:large subunit ribosomal protein L21